MTNNIFIQARIGSKRFPKKIIKKILGKTILELIIERLEKVSNINKIILVTGSEENNQELINHAKKINIEVFCGSEENLLDRFYFASKKFPSENIIRILGDCPLIDSKLINDGLIIFKKNNIDLLSMAKKRTFPHGLDFEIFKSEKITKLWNQEIIKYNNTSFKNTFLNPVLLMLENEQYTHYNFENKNNLSNIRLTLDFKQDFEIIKKIYEKLYLHNPCFGLDDIMKLLKSEPNLLEINKEFVIY